jgi:hypothetical protein
MFAFQGPDEIFRFRCGRGGGLGGAHRRTQDPKTPVERALWSVRVVGERIEHQSATIDVLKATSASPRDDVALVF